MRILELFAGYGSQALALENLGIKFTSDISEIDKYAIQAYNQLHGDTHNWGDITKIDETKLPYYDLITYSSPCQDFSVAGLQRGGDKDSGTRSSLLWECERIIRAVKPKYLLMENVKNLVGEKHKHNFIKWLKVLESFGYQNFWKVLNAKDYGVPQNRERVFVVSILGGGQYLFPNPVKLEKRLKDVLESDVDEKYYVDSKLLERLLYQLKLGTSTLDADIIGTQCARQYSNYNGAFVSEPTCVAQRGREDGQQLEVQTEPVTNTLTTVQKDNYIVEPAGLYIHDSEAFHKKPLEGLSRCLKAEKHDAGVVQVGNIVETDSFGGNPQRGRVYDYKGIIPCLSTMQGGGLEPKIIEEDKNDRNKRIRALLRVLWREIRKKKIFEEIGRFYSIQEKEILQSGMYEESDAKNRQNWTSIFERTYDCKRDKPIVIEQEMLRNMWHRIKNRYSPHRWGLSEQQFRQLDGCLQKLPYENTQTEEKLYCVWETSKGSKLLRETLSEIQEIWKSTYDKQRARTYNYRIRKLTPRECWRLQGVKDEQFNKLHDISNTQLYKLAGNSIVVDVLMEIFKNLLVSDEGTKGQLTLL